jgi:hypothetical protein
MKYPNLSLFLIACFLSGVSTLVGSVVGHGLGTNGLFLGAGVGGILGVLGSTWLAVRLKLIERSNYRVVSISGIAGLTLASVITVLNLHTVLIPLMSVALVGCGAVVGNKYMSRLQAAKSNTTLAVLGLVLAAPALSFVAIALLKYGFKVDQPFNLLESSLSNPDRFSIFNLVSPFVFLGGLCIALVLNLFPQIQLQIRRDNQRVVATITAEAKVINLAMAILCCLLLAVLVGYAALENLSR